MITPVSLLRLALSASAIRSRLAFILIPLCCISLAAPSVKASTNIPANYLEVSRGPNSRILEGTQIWTNALGRAVTNKTSYTEVASGLSRWDAAGAKWIPSSNQIQITANGASMTNCAHQVFFPADVNSGSIDLITPEGLHMTSDIAALVYFDGVTNVVIATPQDSIGQLLPTLTQVIFTNVLSNAVCDVLYDCTLAGLSQTIVIRQQLPPPESFGLTASNIWLQIWTEFTASPTPSISETQTGESLDFGQMKMGKGTAFMLGTNAPSVPVFKQWFSQSGRTFLIESVLLSAIQPQLQQLPGTGSSGSGGGQSRLSRPHPMFAASAPPPRKSKQIELPARKLAKKSTARMRLAKSAPAQKGLALDYEMINGNVTNFTWKSDSTYFVTNGFYVYGTNVIEGGTVVKFARTSGIYLYSTNISFKTGQFRPCIFTAVDDDTVGSWITNSTGTPTNRDYALGGSGALSISYEGFSTGTPLRNLRFSHLNTAISFDYDIGFYSLYDCQFNDCNTAINQSGQSVVAKVYNTLFFNGLSAFAYESSVQSPTFHCQNVTIHNCDSVAVPPDGYTWDDLGDASFEFVNSLIVDSDVSNLSPYLTTNASAILTNDTGVFQTVGAGSHYLADDSPYRNEGTTNIDPALLADLQQKTTYPPVFINGGTGSYYTNDLTLYPQAQRESGDAPDLGWSYDPIDFAFSGIFVTNSTFTVMPGTVISALVTNGGGYGLTMGSGGRFLCQGTPTSLCRIVNFNTVQEQYTTNFVGEPSWDLLSPNSSGNPPASVIECRFTDFSLLAQDANFLYDPGSTANTGTIDFQDCQFHGGKITVGDSTVNLTNCLLERVKAQLYSTDGNVPTIRNNLFYGGTFDFYPSVTNALVKDNVFDQTSIPTSLAGYGYNGGFNAFLTNCDRMLPTNSTDLLLTNITFQAGPLSYYYYPTNTPLTPLIDGDTLTTAAQVGLFHYTTTTNEVKEANSPLDIGFHLVALGANGLPVDTTGCGTPDYLRDANGNGLVDSGELSWTNAADLGLNVIITRPANNSIIP
jgi:hypothetical protein